MAEDRKPLIPITGLFENKTKNGDQYFNGLFGMSKVLIFRNREQQEGKPGWTMYVQEKEPKNGQGYQQGGQQGGHQYGQGGQQQGGQQYGGQQGGHQYGQGGQQQGGQQYGGQHDPQYSQPPAPPPGTGQSGAEFNDDIPF